VAATWIPYGRVSDGALAISRFLTGAALIRPSQPAH